MNKFRQWLKTKLRNFLEIDNDIKTVKDKLINHQVANENQFDNLNDWLKNKHENIKNDISHLQESIKILHNTVENVVHIGTDVREYNNNREHSWAVVCVEGNVNIVKFVDLNRNDSRYVLDFLKQFEAGKHCIDTPRKELFYDGMFKF